MTGVEDVVEVPLIGKKVMALLLGTALFGSLPVFSKMLGFDFLPSTDWIARSNLVGITVGLAFSASALWLVLKSVFRNPSCKWWDICFGVIVAPSVGYLVRRNIVVVVGPMALALISGQQIELPFIVAKADRDGARGCRSPIELQELPYLFDSLCGISNEIRRDVALGQKVVVTGYGTNLGLFAESFR